jgi:hypothetical protein
LVTLHCFWHRGGQLGGQGHKIDEWAFAHAGIGSLSFSHFRVRRTRNANSRDLGSDWAQVITPASERVQQALIHLDCDAWLAIAEWTVKAYLLIRLGKISMIR